MMKNLKNFINIFSITVLTFMLAIETFATNAQSQTEILYGHYPNSGFTSEINGYNTWANSVGISKSSIGATFVSIDDSYNMGIYISDYSSHNAVPFINIMPNPNNSVCNDLRDFSSGRCDIHINAISSVLKSQNKKVFIAFYPEMNGYWTFQDYYGSNYADSNLYKESYKYFRNKILSNGVSRDIVNFVFAPNNWASSPTYDFENFYAGEDFVDIIGFSSFNFNTCGGVWTTFENGFKPYLDRMTLMSPNKPIFITQTGVIGTDAEKILWMNDTLLKLKSYKNVRAFIYFNYKKVELGCGSAEMDFRIYKNEVGQGIIGLSQSFYNNGISYWSISDSNWSKTFPPPQRIFLDVNPINPLTGKIDHISILYRNGVSGGCTYNPTNYCPSSLVTRSQMAVFLLKSKYGSTYYPPPASHYFTDSVGHWAEAWIDQLKRENISSGCGNNNYCPENSITRAEMSVFLLRAKYGSSYNAPVVPITFLDTGSHWARYWIEKLKTDGITYGCAINNYCPDNLVRRDDMAIFIVNTFNLK